MSRFDAALALRARCPWIALSDAIAWTRPERKRYGAGGFLNSGYTRHDVAFAYAWYSLLWGPTPYDARLYRMRVSLGPYAALESEDLGVKEVYGAIVRREHAELVGFQRLQKHMPELSWPGTRNMPRGVRAWLRAEGLLEAVDAFAGAA